MNILLIDDEEEIRATLQEILEKHGHSVTTAANGAEGLSALSAASPGTFRLVMVDLAMPVMSGEAFLEALSERPQARQLAVIVLTATHAIPTSVLPVQILRKPVRMHDLIKMIEELG